MRSASPLLPAACCVWCVMTDLLIVSLFGLRRKNYHHDYGSRQQTSSSQNSSHEKKLWDEMNLRESACRASFSAQEWKVSRVIAEDLETATSSSSILDLSARPLTFPHLSTAITTANYGGLCMQTWIPRLPSSTLVCLRTQALAPITKWRPSLQFLLFLSVRW